MPMRHHHPPPLAALLAMLLLLVLLCTASATAVGQQLRTGPAQGPRAAFSVTRPWGALASGVLPRTPAAEPGASMVGGLELPRPWQERWAPPAAWQSVTRDLKVGIVSRRSLSSWRMGSRRLPALFIALRWNPPY